MRVRRVTVHRSQVRRVGGAPFLVEEMYRRGNAVRLYAIVIAPVDTGNYVSRFLRADAVRAGVNEKGMAYARVSNDARRPQAPGGAPYCYFLEVGTRYMAARRILRRALQAAA